MQYLRRNYIDVIIFLLVLVMAYFSSKIIINYPGMSISGWMFVAMPVVAIVVTIAILKINAQTGYSISTLFLPFPRKIDKRISLLVIFIAAMIGFLVIFNPFDSIMPLFIGIIIFLFIQSVYMVINNKSIDGIGLLIMSFPFINYVEYQLISLETGFSFDWITIKIAIILLFALIWFINNFFIYKKSIVKGKFNALILLFILATFFSALFSGDITFSLKRWLFEIIYPIMFYFLIINSIRYEIDIRRFMFYLLANVYLNLTIVLYYFAKYGSGNIAFDRYFLNLNFADGTLVANTLIMTIPIVIAFLATTNIKSMKLLFYIMLALGMAGLMLSFTRLTQITVAIGLSAFFFNKRTRKYLILFLVAIVLIFIFNFEKLEPYLSRYKDLTSIENIAHESSLEKRYGGWRAALEMFKDHPLFGVGIGRFVKEYANYSQQYYAAYARGYVSMISAHNMYLNYLAETGTSGILLLVTIFSTIVIKGFSLIKKAEKNYVFKYSLLVSVFIFLGNNLFDGITFAYVKEIEKGLIFWSIVAVIMSYRVTGRNQGYNFFSIKNK